MQRIFQTPGPHALFDTAQTRRIEAQAQAALPPYTLMQRAGVAVSQLALAIAPHAARVWIAAGPGNNGGDGFEAAANLRRHGRQVELTLAGDTGALPADARHALARAQAAGVRIDPPETSPLGAHDLAIDALLGIGAGRAPQGALAEAIARLNALPCAVLAIDLPSGLQADTGQPWGGHCVVASHTLALLTLKPGLFTAAGRDHAGAVWLDALGVATDVEAPVAWLAGTGVAPVAAPAPRKHAMHKGSFGDVAIVGGAPGMAGAALLAARAAHAAGAGRIYVALLDAATTLRIDPLRPELMFRQAWWDGPAEVLKRTSVVCGCGGGDAVRGVLPRLLSRVPRLVLDADALNAIAADTGLQAMLRARAGRGLQTVLTPHPLEAARLLGCGTPELQSQRLRSAQRLADSFECVAVLKGSGSIVAAPAMVPRINATGNASLASAGTGDVLAGWLGGRWAQAAEMPTSAFDVAVQAVIAHGAAAEPLRPGSLRAGDLIEAMHCRLRGGG